VPNKRLIYSEYHEATKHTVESLRRSRDFLDWETMPDPFRHYEGAPVLDLPADPERPAIPALSVLMGGRGETRAVDGAPFLSQLLYYSAAISATKRVPSSGYQYALRVNPSSGNLHPTEFHFLTRGLAQWPDGLYHYRPSSHMAEQRAEGAVPFPVDGSLVFVLTSIAWREEWKYRDRAYRYCLHDIGHAWESLALAAQAMGFEAQATAHFCDDDVTAALQLHGDEWPMLAVEIKVPGAAGAARSTEVQWHPGAANPLSSRIIEYPRIEEMHASAKLGRANMSTEVITRPVGSGALALPQPAPSERAYGEVARTRRSALDFRGGEESISFAALSALLAAASQPLQADFAVNRFIQLYLYIHRVDGVEPGVYRYWPGEARLELVRSGDQRVAAAGLSLGQDLAGNACVAFSMIADMDNATRLHGDRGYRYVFFEAGTIGQRLYLAAESLGVRATGIGAFYDDQVHSYLGIEPRQGQVIYHFAIGHPVHDPRIEA